MNAGVAALALALILILGHRAQAGPGLRQG